MKTAGMYLFLTIVLWPFAILMFVFSLRNSLTRFPERLSLYDATKLRVGIDNWLYYVDGLCPLGKRHWFVDKPKRPLPYNEIIRIWKEEK